MEKNKTFIDGKEVAYILCDVGPRFLEDASVNGVEEKENAPVMPMLKDAIDGKRFVITIDVENGKILGWPEGVEASTWYKICDDGIYTFQDINGTVIKEIESYVPDFLAIGDDGFGDYMYLDIDGNGYIKDWKLTQKDVADALQGAF